MSKTILANVDGFTPVIDSVVDDVGLMTAVVFGRMWRYAQMEDGVCRAALDEIAKGIGVSYKTVQRHVEELCEAGYLNDTTPDLRNRPHVYADTGKAGLKLNISAGSQSPSGRSESPTARSESPSRLVRKSDEESKKKGKKKDISLSAEEIAQANAQVDAILANAGKEKYRHREKFPEMLVAYADLYHELTGQEPDKKNLMDWLSTFSEWHSKGLQAEHIRRAYKDIVGWSVVTRPGRLTDTAYAFKSQAKAQPDQPAYQPVQPQEAANYVPAPRPWR